MNTLILAALSLVYTADPVSAAEAPKVYFQCHRGGGDGAPENTLPAIEHAWSVPGGVPEVDLRTTRDDVIVIMHDRSAARTTDAVPPVSELFIDEMTLEQVRALDAGIKFGQQFKGTRVPMLEEIFARMQGHPEREIYLDLKQVKLESVVAMIDRFQLRGQVLFVHDSPVMCKKLSGLWPGARVMTWISLAPEGLKQQFEKLASRDFNGVKQLQFHLPANPGGPPYQFALDEDYLKSVVERLNAKGIALQLRLFDFDAASLRRLFDIGVTWYVTDAPDKFHKSVEEALGVRGAA